ncbi:ROK family transcriptional regulator [Aureimonas sp. Leaf454]|uniref:ROK family transcriptional regulator n=1 Tax=Aureimonas sp. Leaf454 TaxID=1736381 RepID=UPI000AD7056B|nr:ROK family transcriptional regulator [Aureimonas sp. Leaf454]
MSMPRAVRHINATRALGAIFRKGPMSRADLARELGLTRATAGSIVAELAEAGLVVEVGEQDEAGRMGRTGRPGTIVRLRGAHSAFIGADLAVGRMTVVALDLAAGLVDRRHEAFTPSDLSPPEIIDRLVGLISASIARLSASHVVRGLCVTVPGIVDKAGTVARLPIMGWRNEPLLPRLRAAFPELESILVENDAKAAALAEHEGSAPAPGAQTIHLFMDAGIGGAVVADGRLQRGSGGYAGEFGHISIGERGFVDGPALPGSLESFVGREALLARHRFHGGTGDRLDDVVEALMAGRPAALAALDDWSHHLGRALALLAAIFDPAEIIVGGPLAVLLDAAEPATLRSMRRHLMPDHPMPRLTRSALGADGPAIGGATLLHRAALRFGDGPAAAGDPMRSLDRPS